ncbi:hypothetical protein H1C71_029069, partial [Ictidomys tridecemlineatus]
CPVAPASHQTLPQPRTAPSRTRLLPGSNAHTPRGAAVPARLSVACAPVPGTQPGAPGSVRPPRGLPASRPLRPASRSPALSGGPPALHPGAPGCEPLPPSLDPC